MATQLCPTTAFYLGIVLIGSTALTTISLQAQGLPPILFIVANFLVACSLLNNRIANFRGRFFLAITGISGALMCHFALSWFLSFNP